MTDTKTDLIRAYHDPEAGPGWGYYIGPEGNGSLDKAIATNMSEDMAKAFVEVWNRRPTYPHEGVEAVVKPLEWRDLTSPREDGPSEPTGDVEAYTMIGEYSVCFDDDEDMMHAPWCCWSPNECVGHFADFDEAKAAAEADYRTRILSALASPPAPVVTVDALLDAYDAETKKLPLGHEMPTRGASTYNWRRSVVDELRALSAALGARSTLKGDKPKGVTPLKPHEFSADPYTSKCMYCGVGRGGHDEGIRAWQALKGDKE